MATLHFRSGQALVPTAAPNCWAKQKKGDLSGAMADYDQAIKLNPDYAIAFRNRGIAKQKKGDNDEAIADFNRAIKLGSQRGDVEMTPD